MADSTKPAAAAAAGREHSSPDMDIMDDAVRIHPPLVPMKQFAASAAETSRKVSPQHVRFREDPFEFLRELSLYYSGSGWRAYENPIGQPIFYKGYSENLKNTILSNARLRARITELADRRVKVEEEKGLFLPGQEDKKQARRREIVKGLLEMADKTVDGMICKFESKRFIRMAYFVTMQITARAYHQGIHVNTEEILRLRSFASLAAKRKQSLIFLPCHRSHIDYVSLQLICYRLGIGLPSVVAGDNLNFPIVGTFLQNAGAFYIRRSFGNDLLYPAIVQSYVDALLNGGLNFECFIEGGRSRTGKLLPPKFGILRFILDSLLASDTLDAYVIPVSTQYDKVIETESYVSELLGLPKKKENLMDFLSASSILSLRMGRVDVRFHEPWSLRDFVESTSARMALRKEDLVTQGSPGRTRLLRTLGYKVLADINSVSIVMPTSLIGTCLLTTPQRGIGLRELWSRVDWLCNRIRSNGGRVADFGSLSTESVVARGMEVLGDLVGKEEGLAEVTYFPRDRFQLSFYRNMVMHLFVSESIVCCSILSQRPSAGPMTWNDLLKKAIYLSRLFRNEFVFPPIPIEENLRSTLRSLEKDGVVACVPPTGNITHITACPKNQNSVFYHLLLAPFIEGLYLAGASLLGLPAGSPLSSNLLVTNGQTLGRTLYAQGRLRFFESVNTQALKNAFGALKQEGILKEAVCASGKGGETLMLDEEVVMSGKLKEWVVEVASYRGEGYGLEQQVEELSIHVGDQTLEKEMQRVLKAGRQRAKL